ncbi:MAG: MFS transporter, partial [Phycisphaerales bacterium]|nr:MFS transporter [Phycisphaerales bacterium]
MSDDTARSSDGPSWLGVLRHHDYRLAWTGSLVSNIGTWMEHVGIQWIAAEKTGSPVFMGTLAAAQMMPVLFLGLVGGLAADRVDRRWLLILTQGMLMLIAAALCVASVAGWITTGVLIGLGLAQGIVTAFNIPAWQTLTPRLVPRAELGRAINLNSVQFNLARVVGPALGGVLLALTSPTWLFAINTLSFLAVIAAVWRTDPAPPVIEPGRTWWADLGESLRFVLLRRGPLALLIGLVLYSALAGPILRLLPMFVKDVYHAQEEAYGVLMAVMGLGAVAGGLALKLVPTSYPRHHLIPLSICAGGLSIVGFAAAPNVWVAGATLVVVGLFWVWSFSVSFAAIQLLAEERARGRVLSIYNVASFGATPLGALLAAWAGSELAGAGSGEGPVGRGG